MCLLCWHDSPLYNFGASANKIARYLSANKQIIQAFNGNHEIVSKYNAGIIVPANDIQAFSNAIADFSKMGSIGRKKYIENARGLFLAQFELSVPGKKLNQLVLNLLERIKT